LEIDPYSAMHGIIKVISFLAEKQLKVSRNSGKAKNSLQVDVYIHSTA